MVYQNPEQIPSVMAEESNSVTEFMNTMLQSVEPDDNKSESDAEEFMDVEPCAYIPNISTANSVHYPISQNSSFMCKVCEDHVRGGAITICGHLYCWTCLWPKICNRRRPRCPCCLRRLVLHEDIVPFLSDGPYDSPNEGIVLAQPGNVPRPTGMYLKDQKYPRWFKANLLEEDDYCDRNLSKIVESMYREFPRVMNWTRFLRRFELICALLLATIGFFVITFGMDH